MRTLWPVLALVSTLAWASFQNKTPGSPSIPHFDKIAHFFVFGLLGTLWFRCFPREMRPLFRWLGAFVLVLAYGVIDEWIQYYNPQRTSDFLDWVADGLGATTAILVYHNWRLYRRLLETPVVRLFRLQLADVD